MAVSNAFGSAITREASVYVNRCYADCDTSTGFQVLDIFDFLCFLNHFAAGDLYACECDYGQMSTCDVFDFLCFGERFAAGCQ
jgi:hypothetical protein